MLPEAAVLLGIPAGVSGFMFREKPVVLVVAAVVVVVVAAVEVVEAAPGGFRLKPSVPAPAVPAVVAGVPRESPVAVDEVGAAASEVKSEGPALAVVAAGVGAAGWVAPAPVAAGVAAVKGSPLRAGGWAGPPREPTLKPEVPVWDVLPLVNEKPPDVDVVGGAADAVVEPNTKPPGAAPWADVLALETAPLSVLPPSPKPLGCVGAGAAAVLPRLSFGVLLPKENPVAPAAGVVVPKLKAGVCVAGVWVLSENRLVEGVLAADWEGIPKLNLPVPDVEEKKPVVAVVVAVFAVPKVNPPVGAPVPPKLKPLMAPDSGDSSYSGSKANPPVSATLGRFAKQGK